MTMLLAAMLLVGCSGSDKESSSAEARRLIDEASKTKDFKRMLTLADSLGNAEVISEGESYYWQGFAYYRLMQWRTAEFYWKESMNATENSTDPDELATYTRSASYLTSSYIRHLNFASALKVVKPALERLDKVGFDDSSDYTNLLIFAGCCQAHFNVKDSTVNELFEHAYQRHITHVNESHSKEAYRDAVVGLINIAYGWLSEKQYDMGLVWTERFGTLVADYKKRYADDEAYIDKQWARYQIFTAVGLEGQGKMAEAAEAYASFQHTHFAHTIEGQLDGSDYLSMAGHWQEAAENLTDIEKAFVSEQTGHSLEDIQRYWLKKYHANDKAGLRDTANLVANKICQRLDSAIIKSQWVDAEEQEVIRQKEEQILHQQEHLARARMWGFIATIVSLTIFFVIFTIIRHRAAKRLAKVTAAKERMEGELSIARDIQMSMVPSHFPDYQGLDMHASMTPAKEVGGDLYGYVLQGDKLYFCLGDVSGKGVPASLFMAQSTRLFHTLATQQLQPAEICNHMNRELSGEDNVNGMFVTLFLGLLDLKTGHLTFCNAGHNPPVIDAGTPEAAFIDMQPNAPIGLWAELDYEQEEIESIMGRAFFIYTDGLNEAEDAQQNQFGDDRLLDILRSNQYETAWGMVTRLAKDVEQHRNGAEPNDDLTMLCLKFSK